MKKIENGIEIPRYVVLTLVTLSIIGALATGAHIAEGIRYLAAHITVGWV